MATESGSPSSAGQSNGRGNRNVALWPLPHEGTPPPLPLPLLTCCARSPDRRLHEAAVRA
eukprot:CAMPEP_0177615254 /NCGR_PEP_ID=MMETSP0419_2-20121207/23310_1 /TAXON_ID=582737 /ORGANISM="Tetraselmis sp., Strain GSL018" /LENGTH=59 /DNA_ID=CAMNT_0019112805 /DNA_START=56 /DNA_END=231 /DNA_ORIENTATION=-